MDAFDSLAHDKREEEHEEDDDTEFFSADENEGEFDDDNGYDTRPRDSIALSWGGFEEDIRDDEELLKAFEAHESKLKAIKDKGGLFKDSDSELLSVEDSKELSLSDSEIIITGDDISKIKNFEDGYDDGDDDDIIGNVKCNRRRIRFAEDTYEASPVTIACTFCGHQYVPALGSITYAIQFSYGGIMWRLDKRYNDFVKFYRELKNEKLVKSYELPELPQKRWFEGQRWLNRFEYKFTLIRRLGLQAFLRDVFRIPKVAERSTAVQNFVGLKERVQFSTSKGIEYASLTEVEVGKRSF